MLLAFMTVHVQDLDEVQLVPAAKRRRTIASRPPADLSKIEQPDLAGMTALRLSLKYSQLELHDVSPLLCTCAGQLIKGLHNFLAGHDLSAQTSDNIDQHAEEDRALYGRPGPTLQELSNLSDIVNRLGLDQLEATFAETLLQVIDVLAPLVNDSHRQLLHVSDLVRSGPTRHALLTFKASSAHSLRRDLHTENLV